MFNQHPPVYHTFLFAFLTLKPGQSLEDFRHWNRVALLHLVFFVVQLIVFSIGYFVLKNTILDQDTFLYWQLWLSRGLVGGVFLQIIFLIIGNWHLFRGVLAAYLYLPTAPQNLALMRIVLMFLLAGHLAFQVPAHLSQVAALPHSARQGLPFIGWLIDILPISPGIYGAMTLLGIIFCLMAAAGLFTRTSLVLSTLILCYVLGVPNFFGKVNHTHFMVWLPAFLAFSPAGEVWSLDALLRRKRGEIAFSEPHYRFGIPMRLMFLQLGLIYFFSAIGKLWISGLEWALSDNLVYLMRLEWLENFSDVPAIRLDHFPNLCRFLAMGVIAFELLYIFLILTPKTRVIAVFSAISFHNITHYFLLIDFKFLQMINAFQLDIFGILKKIAGHIPKLMGSIGLLLLAIGLLWINQPLGLILFAGAFYLGFYRKDFPVPDLSRQQPPVSVWVWRIGLGILVINMGFGITQTTSWPFTAYPSYSFMRSGTVEYVWFRPIDVNGSPLDLDILSQEAGFRKENILGIAEEVTYAYKYGDQANFELLVRNYWLRFREKVPVLKDRLIVPVVLQELNTDPDIPNPIVKEVQIGILEKVSTDWEWKAAGVVPAH